MNKTIKKSIGMLFIGACVSFVGGVTLASEPGNNSFPLPGGQITGDWELIGANGTVFSPTLTGTMNSTTDVDYVFVNCTSPARYIKTVRLGNVLGGTGTMPGDYDVYVYLPTGGSPIASGTLAGTGAETVDVSAFVRSTFVAEVVYYAGNLGNYGLRIDCGA